ncbi:MAG: VTT domain-containing protein [Raoultibacter sp.]
MEIIQFFIELLQDPRAFIVDWIANLGPIGAYVPIFLIVFIETGVVIMPFLPGDSLLFTAGFFAADGGGLNLFILLPVVWVAAILGDQCNYWIGREFGRRIIDSGKVKSMTPERIEKTEALLDKYGPVAIFLGRFFPFIRTFVPFFAGLGRMHYKKFIIFNILGALVWSTVFVLLGFFFGGIPVVQEHFELVIVAIIVVSLIPAIGGVLKAKFGKKKSEQE